MRLMYAVILALLSHIAVAQSQGLDPENVRDCTQLNEAPERCFPQGLDLQRDASALQDEFQDSPGIETLDFLQDLLAQAEKIRGQGTSDPGCTGSIVRMRWAQYSTELSLAGNAPRLLLKAKMGYPLPGNLEDYFSHWALLSPTNMPLYDAFVLSRREAQPLLAKHYRERFGLAPNEAKFAADRALELIARRAAGEYPNSFGEPMYDEHTAFFSLTSLVAAAASRPELLAQALAAKPAAAQLDQALRMALVRNLPLSVTTQLVSQMTKLDSGDESALFLALHNPDAVELLLSNGAAVDYANGFGKTPLFYAIENGDKAMVSLLLKHGANPNHPYKSTQQLEDLKCEYEIQHTSRTPLMHAAQHSDTTMLALLVDNGARLDAVDGLGWKAEDYATRNNRPENAVFLSSRGSGVATNELQPPALAPNK